MINNVCSLCKGLGMVWTNTGGMTKCPACKGRVTEFDEMSKKFISQLEKVIEEKEPEDMVQKWRKERREKNKKPLKWKKGNGKGKEDY